MAGVIAQRVNDIDDRRAQPGAFEFYVAQSGDPSPVGMTYCCPCGCGLIGALPFKPERSPSWTWDGDPEKPTLHPSVHHKIDGKTHWHGWLTKGVWEAC